MKRTKNLSLSVIEDAILVCNSIQRFSASSAVGYAFGKTQNGRKIEYGEYIFRGYEDDVTPERFDGLISFEDKKLKDLKTCEVIQLK